MYPEEPSACMTAVLRRFSFSFDRAAVTWLRLRDWNFSGSTVRVKGLWLLGAALSLESATSVVSPPMIVSSPGLSSFGPCNGHVSLGLRRKGGGRETYCARAGLHGVGHVQLLFVSRLGLWGDSML